MATYFPFVQMLSGFAGVIVLGVGAGLIHDGRLTPGALVAFVLYIDLFFSPIQQLSRAGQRQLLALARAQLVDPAILLLDEATSNLDLVTEARVNEAMAHVSRGRTTILIAHRLQTARYADRIVVLDSGQVAEVGDHDELVAGAGRRAPRRRGTRSRRSPYDRHRGFSADARPTRRLGGSVSLRQETRTA